MNKTVTIAGVDYDLRPAMGYKEANPCAYCDLAFSARCRARYGEKVEMPCTDMDKQYYLKKSKMQTA